MRWNTGNQCSSRNTGAVHQSLCSLLGQHPANCTDVADVNVRGTADLVDVCLYTQPAVPQHSEVVWYRSNRDVGSRNAESWSTDVVLTSELDDDRFFLIHHQFVYSYPGSDLLNTVLYIANSPSGVKDLGRTRQEFFINSQYIIKKVNKDPRPTNKNQE